jgi:hypothetical protein
MACSWVSGGVGGLVCFGPALLQAFHNHTLAKSPDAGLVTVFAGVALGCSLIGLYLFSDARRAFDSVERYICTTGFIMVVNGKGRGGALGSGEVPALEPGSAALAEGVLQESVECSGGGRLRDVAGQMVFDPAVITARLRELLEAMAGEAERFEQALELGCPGLPGERPWLPSRHLAGSLVRNGSSRMKEGVRLRGIGQEILVACTGFKPSV